MDTIEPSDAGSQTGKTKIWIIVGVAAVLLCLCCLVLVIGGFLLFQLGVLDWSLLGFGLNPSAEPRAGAIDLQGGFSPDPYMTPASNGGGTLNVYNQNLGGQCVGFTARQPDYVLNWSGETSRLRIFYLADNNADAALVIYTPNGQYLCNDDFSPASRDPMVQIPSPSAGAYAIWITNLAEGQTGSGRLYITQFDLDPLHPDFSDRLNPGAEPAYGEIALSSGFQPDPYTAAAAVGGNVDVNSLDLEAGCLGYTTSEPTFRLNLTGSLGPLNIFFMSDHTEDTTLIIRTPDGRYLCNDDSGYSFDPMLTLSNPQQGEYLIWIGSYWPEGQVSGTLYLTQQDLHPGNIFGQGELDPSLDPLYGETSLQPGFSPDPYTVFVQSGSSLDVWSMNIPGCGGFAESAPTFRLNWSGSTETLSIGFVDDLGGDTTMVVQGPGGEYYCNDDSNSSLNPTVRINNPPPGEYNIWVNSYQRGGAHQGYLSITDAPVPSLNPNLSPIFGSRSLQAGFSPDPYTVNITAGGPIDVRSSPLYAYGCIGWATEAPTYQVVYSGSSSRLRFFFIASDSGDSTMSVLAPNGVWYCNDDSGFPDRNNNRYNPLVDIFNPPAGVYLIWVGSYSSNNDHPGTLYITGQDINQSNIP